MRLGQEKSGRCAETLKRGLNVFAVARSGIFGQCGAVIGDGPLLLALVVVEHGAIGKRIAIRGVELDRLRIVGERAIDIAGLLVGDAAVVIGDGIRRIERDSGGAILDREIGLPLVLVSNAAIDEGVGKAGIDLNGLAEIDERGVRDRRARDKRGHGRPGTSPGAGRCE